MNHTPSRQKHISILAAMTVAFVDATNRVLDKQDGPAVLVSHSWGPSPCRRQGHRDCRNKRPTLKKRP